MGRKDENISLLCYIKPLMILSGAFPYEMVNINKNLYILYRYIIQGTFLLFLILLIIQIPYIHGSIDVLVKNVIMLYTYSIMYTKGLVCLSENMRKLILDMISKEAKVKVSNDEKVINMYRSVVRKSKMIQIFYISLTYSTGMAFIAPAIKFATFGDKTEFNATVAETNLPYQMWLPFDKEKYYLAALSIQVYCALLAINYYCYIQSILVILPLNVTFRLNILGNNLRNIDASRKLDKNTDYKTRDLEDVKDMVRNCIIEHIDIIRNCSVLNETVKYLMLLEFLLSSAQMSLLLIQLTTTNETNVRLFSLVYLFQFLAQLLVLYWYADEIREQSVAICDALYEMQWYEYNKSINTSIQIMMIRSQKPLSLTVGPFGEMSLAMAVKIMKAAYTYVTFMQRTYGET